MKKFRTPLVVLIAAVVLVASLAPVLILEAGGFHIFHAPSVSFVLLAMWLAVPFAAAKLKSKALFKMYSIHWIAANAALAFFLAAAFTYGFSIGELDDGGFLLRLVVIFYAFSFAPFIAISHLLFGSGLLLLPLCMFLYGFFVKRKFFKEEQQNGHQ